MQFRFIPVCTGNMSTDNEGVKLEAVYPCVYREHAVPFPGNLMPAGLSLCVQGTLLKCFMNDTLMRFIPVCTGNIITFELCSNCVSVYPCVYREHKN